jgi:glutaredoxin
MPRAMQGAALLALVLWSTEGRLEAIAIEMLPSSALPAAAVSHMEQWRKSRAESNAPRTERFGLTGTVLYSAKWCPYCREAKAYLAGKAIAFQEFDIDTRPGLEAFAGADGGKGVPLLVSGAARVQGYRPAAYDAFFARRK